MKTKILSLILCATMIMGICAVGAGAADASDTTTNSKSSNKVYLLDSKTTYDSEGNIKEQYEYSYDENGKVVRENYYEPIYNSGHETINTYDSYGRIISQQTVNDNDKDSVYTWKWTYDEDGNISSYGLDSNIYVYTYIYDSMGNIIKCTKDSGELAFDVVTYEYDENGNIITETEKSQNLFGQCYYENISIYDSYGNLINYKHNTNIDSHSYEYTIGYDSCNRVANLSYIDSYNLSYDYTFINEYDENGNIIARIGSNNRTSGWGYVYEYDDDGNILNETYYDDLDAGVVYSTTVYVYQAKQITFSDVPINSYYTDAVAWAVENNITTGTSETEFSPTMNCTRAQIVTFLWRAAGCPEPDSDYNPFVDVVYSEDTEWYYTAVLWAVENDITTGTSETTFEPDAVCTRAQIVTFLWRYAGKPAIILPIGPTKITNDYYEMLALYESQFVDVTYNEDSAWYYEAVLWAIQNEITNGTSETTFEPAKDCTRAEIVTFLCRYFVNVVDAEAA